MVSHDLEVSRATRPASQWLWPCPRVTLPALPHYGCTNIIRRDCFVLFAYLDIRRAVISASDLNNDQTRLVTRVLLLLLGNVLVETLADGLRHGLAVDLGGRHAGG